MHGGVDYFENLEVIDSHSSDERKVVVTVYEQLTGLVLEVFELRSNHYETTETLEQVFEELGFVRKPDDEIARIRDKYEKEESVAKIGKTEKDLNDGQLREHLMNEAWKAAEALQQSKEGDELNHLSNQIKKLRQQINPTEEVFKHIEELQQERLLLLRQQMLTRQFQVDTGRI